MLQSIEEIREAEIEAGVVINGVDNPNILSIDATDPNPTKADEVIPSEDEKKAAPDLPEKEVEVKAEEKEEEEPEKKPEPEPEPSSSKVVKRIGDLTKKWRTAERERDFEKDKRREAEVKLKEFLSKVPDESRPLKEDFDDEDDYLEALTDWKIESRFKASQDSVAQEAEEKDEKQAIDDSYEGLDNAMDRGRDKYDDFESLVLAEDLIISPEVMQILLDTESPEEVMYYLASNPEESARISELDPIRVAKEIGKIEVRLTKEEKGEVKEKPKPSKKQSNAPAPITPVKTTGVTEKDPNKMSPKEYREWREKSSS